MNISRQQRRARAREKQKITKNLFRWGLSPDHDQFSTSVLTFYLYTILSKNTIKGRATKVAEISSQVFEISLKENPPPVPIECKKKCIFCCHNFVGVTIPEVFLIANQIKSQSGEKKDAIISSIKKANKITRGLNLTKRITLNAPCPLLNESLCSIYNHRPLPCRGFASLSKAECEESFKDPLINITRSEIHDLFRSKCTFALIAALKIEGLKYDSFEMNGALEVALEEPDAENRWLSGEDIFEGVQIDGERPDFINSLLDQIIKDALE